MQAAETSIAHPESVGWVRTMISCCVLLVRHGRTARKHGEALLTAVPYEAERKGGRQDSQRVNGGRTYCTDGGEKKGALDPTWNSCRAGSGQGQLFKRPGYVLKQPTHQFSSAAQGRRGQVSRLDVFTNRGGEKRGKQTGKQRTQLFLQLFRRRSQASRRHTKRRS